MVRSIRFWGLAAKLLIEDPKSVNRRSPGIVPTRVGHGLFGEMGWDPFMEDPGTLWLLHWLLMAPRSRLPVWWVAFNDFDVVEFEDADLDLTVETQLEAVSSWKMPHSRSLRKRRTGTVTYLWSGDPVGPNEHRRHLGLSAAGTEPGRGFRSHRPVPFHARTETHPPLGGGCVCRA